MDNFEAWKKVNNLIENPELANTPGYEIEDLRNVSEARDWFYLLAEQPQFEPPAEWWFKLRRRCNLPWAMLLVRQPQFEKQCNFAYVSRLDLMRLFFLSPDLLKKHFPKGNPHELWNFLTPFEKAELLSEFPQLEKEVNWDELKKEFGLSEWFRLMANFRSWKKR